MHEEVVLYFISGMSPTREEAAEAAMLRAKIRNAKLAADEQVEYCTFVAGPAIPKEYAGYPIAAGAKVDTPDAAGANPDMPIHEMTVKQLRAYAVESGIQIPAHISTKEEITAHIEQYKS